jgi:hypothetical protein
MSRRIPSKIQQVRQSPGALGLPEILMALAFISGHLWMPTWAIANLTKGHVRTQMVRFLLPLLSFYPQYRLRYVIVSLGP